VDVENRRLSLGHKQLTEDVWITFESIFVVGSTHKGTLLSFNDKGGIVELEYGVEGFVPSKHMAVPEGQPKLKTGETHDFKVIEFNKDAKKLVLSYRATWDEETNTEQGDRGRKQGGGERQGGQGGGKKQQQQQTPKPKAETTTLGEISALADLKAQFEAAERKKAEAKLKGMGKGKSSEEESGSEEEAPANNEETPVINEEAPITNEAAPVSEDVEDSKDRSEEE
jgi:small subunit ribosomal protein S1